MKVLSFLVCFHLGISLTTCARILSAFTMPGYSHQMIYRLILNELAKRGHQLTVITGNSFVGELEKSIRVIDVEADTKAAVNENEPLFKPFLYPESDKGLMDMLDIVEIVDNAIFGSKQVRDFLKEDNKFDLVIAESSSPTAVVLKEHFNCPVLVFEPVILKFFIHHFAGNGNHPVAHPVDGVGGPDRTLTLWERISSTVINFAVCFFFDHQNVFDKLKQRHFPNVRKTFKEIRLGIDIMAYVDLPGISPSRPHLQNIIPIGPLHINTSLQLDRNLQKFMDTSLRGVVFVSFGTNVPLNLLRNDRRNIFLEALSELPYDILLKCDEPKFTLPQNVRWTKWATQQAILKHHNLKLFITHAGFQSTLESVHYAKPIIALPFYVDQFKNAELVNNAKVGIKLDFFELTKQDLIQSVHKILENDSVYQRNILKYSNILNDRPLSGLNHFVWLSEHLIRQNGSKYLICPSVYLPFYQYYLLDVFGVLLIIGYVFYKLCYFIVTYK